MNKFEEFLRERHASHYIGTKDYMLDDFSNWLEDLSIDEWINYGEMFGILLDKKALEIMLKDKEGNDDRKNINIF